MSANNWTYDEVRRLQAAAHELGLDMGSNIEKFRPHWENLDKTAAGLASRVVLLVELAGGRGAAAKVLQVGPTTLDNYRRGDTQPKFLELLKLAAVSGVSLEQIVEGLDLSGLKLLKRTSPRIADAKHHAIPRYAIDAAAGDGAVALSQDIEDYFVVSHDWITRFVPAGARLGVIQARGDSMEPTINNADALIVLFDINRQHINEGGVFVFSNGDGIKVKRIQVMLDGRLRISSDNERYEPEYVDQEYADEHLTIHAKVLLKTGPL